MLACVGHSTSWPLPAVWRCLHARAVTRAAADASSCQVSAHCASQSLRITWVRSLGLVGRSAPKAGFLHFKSWGRTPDRKYETFFYISFTFPSHRKISSIFHLYFLYIPFILPLYSQVPLIFPLLFPFRLNFFAFFVLRVAADE